MTYGEVKREALKLAFTDTIAGQDIPNSYNSQADYVLQIPGLVDSALMDIVTRAKHIPEVVQLDDLKSSQQNAFIAYCMPPDYQDMVHSGLVAFIPDAFGEEQIVRFRNYRLIGGKLLVPRTAPKGMSLEYWRFPRSVGSNPADSVQLDGTADMHSAVPYYVAAQLVMYDDAFRYQALRNEYETKITLLHDPVFVEETPVNNVYDFFGGM